MSDVGSDESGEHRPDESEGDAAPSDLSAAFDDLLRESPYAPSKAEVEQAVRKAYGDRFEIIDVGTKGGGDDALKGTGLSAAPSAADIRARFQRLVEGRAAASDGVPNLPSGVLDRTETVLLRPSLKYASDGESTLHTRIAIISDGEIVAESD